MVVGNKEETDMKIATFQGPYRFLSNFWAAEVSLDGVPYPTVEHAYMAAKTEDLALREAIRSADTPGKAKRMAKKLVLRGGWDAMKLTVMANLLAQKFAQGTELRARLNATAPALLEEGNTWGDRFWGVCRGEGENHLGKLLMAIRDARS